MYMKLWAKVWQDTHLIKDMTVEITDPTLNRTRKIFKALEDVCYAYDLSKPIWLNSNIEEFKRHDKTRFSADNFIDSIDFDYLEIHVIEE